MNLGNFWRKINRKGGSPQDGTSGYTNIEVKSTSNTPTGDCRCLNCHREFWYDDFVGICTSLKCSTAGYFEWQHDGLSGDSYIKQAGPRRVLLREQTKSNFPSVFEEAPIEDIAPEGTHLCPACHTPLYYYCCPICRKPMPRMRMGELKNTIAPAGIGQSGKTVYMTILIRQLMYESIIKPNIKMITQFCEKADFARWKTIDDLLNRQKRLPASTNMADVPLPYLVNTQTRHKPDNSSKNAYTLWYDFSGESFEDKDNMNPILQYFGSVGGIIFFIDPTNSKKVVDDLNLPPPENLDPGRDLGVITQISSLLKNREGNYDAIRKKWIAVIVNKIDLFRGRDYLHFNDNSDVWSKSPHRSNGAFCLDDFRNINGEVEDYVKVCHKPIYGQLELFKNHDGSNIGFFAVSALGQEPDGDSLSREIEPIRVEDPFYWMLWKMGHMPAKGAIEAPAQPVMVPTGSTGSFGMSSDF